MDLGFICVGKKMGAQPYIRLGEGDTSYPYGLGFRTPEVRLAVFDLGIMDG